MVFKFLKELNQNLTQDEFKQVLAVSAQDIMVNNIGLKKLTKEKEFIEICKKNLLLIKSDQILGKGM
ncbi:MAG TPA: hypothetical protein DCM59_01805 [Clostridium sp.]|nr:hypothetical protein [Clostridium sp.]